MSTCARCGLPITDAHTLALVGGREYHIECYRVVRREEKTMPNPSLLGASVTDDHAKSALQSTNCDRLGHPPCHKCDPQITGPSPAAELIQRHMDLCQRARDIMVAKNHDYRGGGGDPFANFRGSNTFGIDPIVGILLRMQDKMMRIKTFAEKGQLKVKGEGVEDAILDIINYAALIDGLCREERPTKTDGCIALLGKDS